MQPRGLAFRRRECRIGAEGDGDGEFCAARNPGGAGMTAVASAAAAVARVNDGLLAICKYLVIAIVAGLAAILISAVFYRYALNNAIAWSEEGSKYLMVWLTFLGAPIALRHAGHINIDLLIKMFPPRGRQVFYLIVHLIIIATMGILFWKGALFAQMGARQVASSFNFSMLWMYVAVPIGSALVCLVAVEHVLRALCGIADPANGLEEDHEAFVDEVRE
jgi:TRAP-type C4-dicarboxylate transport system permease small subunit